MGGEDPICSNGKNGHGVFFAFLVFFGGVTIPRGETHFSVVFMEIPPFRSHFLFFVPFMQVTERERERERQGERERERERVGEAVCQRLCERWRT